jgi:Pyruvate/2-oxoacid:ferredoxin oxidoreductase delta subunit
MSTEPTRRDVLGHVARGAGVVAIGGTAFYLARKAGAQGAWTINPNHCINIRLGTVSVEACDKCATECVIPLSAVRAINDHAKCGRCCICPAYFDMKSPAGPDGLPTRKLCPRDAIERKAIGWIDPDDPLNNYYEYIIDETKCNGCGKCVMGCKEPAGLGSIRLEIRYDHCLACNRCSIAQVCPEDAIHQRPIKSASKEQG